MRKYKRIMVLFAFSLLVVSLIACKDDDGSSAPLSKSFLKKAKEGDTFTFGAYEQDNNLENGPEDIEWIVLEKEDGYMTAITEYAIECMPFNELEPWGKTDWETCTLRQWLNFDFYDGAFSDAEKDFITQIGLENPDNIDMGVDGGNITEDYIFLLGREMIEYLYEDLHFMIATVSHKTDTGTEVMKTMLTDPAVYEPLQVKYTEYAKQKRIQNMYEFQDYEADVEASYGENACAWWLRSRGDQDYGTLLVMEEGGVMSCPSKTYCGVQPMFYISLKDN